MAGKKAHRVDAGRPKGKGLLGR
jgi:hypothetical protein